jgi:hypothetical protein
MKTMTLRARSLAAALVILAAAPVAAGCSSGPSYPHSWCAPLIAQFHAKETRQAYIAGIAALEKSGAPVQQLVTDDTALEANQAAANAPGTAGFGAVAAAPALVAKISADQKVLNADCGQAPDAYKSDNV